MFNYKVHCFGSFLQCAAIDRAVKQDDFEVVLQDSWIFTCLRIFEIEEDEVWHLVEPLVDVTKSYVAT